MLKYIIKRVHSHICREDWETSGYKIFVNADHSSGERMDLPGELVNLDTYTATLAHKVQSEHSESAS